MKKEEVKALLRMTRGMDPEVVKMVYDESKKSAQALHNIAVDRRLGLIDDAKASKRTVRVVLPVMMKVLNKLF